MLCYGQCILSDRDRGTNSNNLNTVYSTLSDLDHTHTGTSVISVMGDFKAAHAAFKVSGLSLLTKQSQNPKV